MRFCLLLALLCWTGVAAELAEPVHKVTTVVRADAKTGRLVRSVAVAAKPVRERVVKPVNPAAGPARRSGPDSTLREIVEETAKMYDLEPALVHSVVEVESAYNPFAISTKGAEGLMQLMPSTARRFGVNNTLNPATNVEGGVRYLKYLQGVYGNDLQKILAAYNAGEGAVNRYNGIPRYRETENYVYQVGRRLGEKRAAARTQATKAATTPKPAEPEHRPLEQYRDTEGRIYFRTK